MVKFKTTMPNNFRAFRIDPLTETVDLIWLHRTQYWNDIKQIVGKNLGFVYAPGVANAFIVDDIALMHKPEEVNPRGFWQPDFMQTPICGQAVLIGLDGPEGNMADCQLEHQVVRDRIKFPKVEYVGMQYSSGWTTHPVFGPMATETSTPVFRERPN